MVGYMNTANNSVTLLSRAVTPRRAAVLILILGLAFRLKEIIKLIHAHQTQAFFAFSVPPKLAVTEIFILLLVLVLVPWSSPL